jgi:hypothetical protein
VYSFLKNIGVGRGDLRTNGITYNWLKLEKMGEMRKEQIIPLLCGPIIDTTAYESPHSANLTSFKKLSNPDTLKTPSPSIS